MLKGSFLTALLALTVLNVPQAGAQTAPTVGVRAGAHEDFDRVVFDWPHSVKYQLRREGDRALITFDADANMKLPSGAQDHLTRARGFSAHTDNQGRVTVSFAVNPNATLKTFTNSTSVVIDIQGKAATVTAPLPSPPVTPTPRASTPDTAPAAPAPSSPKNAEEAPPVPQPAEPATNVSASEKPQPLLPPAPAQPTAKKTPPPVVPSKASPLQPPPKNAVAPPKASVPETPAAAIAPIPAPTKMVAAPQILQPSAAEATPVKEKPQPLPQPVPVPPIAKKAPPVAPPKATPPQPLSKNTVVPPSAPALTLPTEAATSETGTTATLAKSIASEKKADELANTPTLVAALDPHIPMRAVIYQRADVGYVIFDRKLSLSLSALENGVPAQVDLKAFDLPKNSAYRFPVPPQADIHATLDGTSWKIFLSKKKSTVPVTTALVAQPDFALGARFLLPLPDAPDPIRITDPLVGDDLILVPLAQSEAFNVERRMSDMTILPAAQGLVIKPLTDKLIVRAVSDGIEITAENGLLLSRPTDTGASRQSPGKIKATAAGKSIFDFTTWKGKPGETFTQTRQRLQQIIVDVPEVERNRARMELARFYFANGDGEEAVSLLNFLADQVPDLRAHADFMALLGAAKVLAYRSEDGVRDLSIPSLAGQPEVDLWLAVGMAQMRDWPNAEEKFSVRKNTLTGYPEPFFSRFFVLAIESALATNRDHEAADWLDYISNADHSLLIDPALAFLRGAIEAKAGHAATAEEAWKEAQASNNRLYKVRAELALIDLGVSTGSLTAAQAADRLEALRFGWRGDDLEVDILRRLGQFYIQAKNIKAGINSLSQAATLYPSSPLAPSIRAEMAKTFHDIFLGDLGKKFSPLDALTLYQQYRTLMPSGKDGDAVLSNLAERLVAVDLLDQAASILEDMAKNRLQGEEKTRVALRLSAIRLLDHKPNESIAALDMIGSDALPTDLQNERALLRARAFSELHRDAEAAALLKDNPSPGAKMLRADIAMHDQKWGEAAKNLMDLVGDPPSTATALSSDQAGWLITAAIAYALANDQPNLDRLAIDYGAAMATKPQKDTFLMLTRPGKTGQLRDLAAAQTQISQVDMFQDFLNNYRSAGAKDTKAKKP